MSIIETTKPTAAVIEPVECRSCGLDIDPLDVADGETELCEQCRCPACGSDNSDGDGHDGFCASGTR